SVPRGCAALICLIALVAPLIFPANPVYADDAGLEICGRVTDPQGLVLFGARVSLSVSSPSGQGAPTIAQTTTDEQGRFAFHKIPAGEYLILARAAGFIDVTLPLSLKPDAAASHSPVNLDLQFTRLAKHNGVVIVSSALEPGIDLRNSD